MCAALWTRQLGRGLPGGTPTTLAPRTQAPRGTVWCTSCPSPFGPLHLAGTPAGVCAVGLREADTAFLDRLARAGWSVVPDRAPLAAAAEELAEYFAGRRHAFTVPLLIPCHRVVRGDFTPGKSRGLGGYGGGGVDVKTALLALERAAAPC